MNGSSIDANCSGKRMIDIEEVLTVHPLYQSVTLSVEDDSAIEELAGKHFQFDCFCPDCQTVRTFTTHRRGVKEDEIRPEAQSTIITMRVVGISGPLWEQNFDFSVTAYCAREEKHVAKFFFRLQEGTLVKIGQIPSLVDMASEEVRKYSKVLGEEKTKELHRAVGLFAHGVGIGAYAYLRRIIETLIDEHKQEAEKVGQSFVDWEKQRIPERIKALSATLPKALVENVAAYGILSKGIHQLTEGECRGHFPLLKQAILLILQQDHERRERQEAERELKKAIARVSGSLAKS